VPAGVSVCVDVGDEFSDKALQIASAQVSYLKHLVVVGSRLATVFVVHHALVSDERQADTAYWTLAVTGNDYFRARAHTCTDQTNNKQYTVIAHVRYDTFRVSKYHGTAVVVVRMVPFYNFRHQPTPPHPTRGSISPMDK